MRTEENLRALTAALERNCGDFLDACRMARLSPSFVRKWQNEDTAVSEALHEAEQVGALALDSEAIRRGKVGIEEDVYYQGEVVGTKRVYSDGLLTLLLKKRRKEVYGDEASQTNVNVNVLNQVRAFERPGNYADWVKLTNLDHAALPPPEEQTVDAEFYAVLPSPELDPAMADIL